jgi:hypothetical protein
MLYNCTPAQATIGSDAGRRGEGLEPSADAGMRMDPAAMAAAAAAISMTCKTCWVFDRHCPYIHSTLHMPCLVKQPGGVPGSTSGHCVPRIPGDAMQYTAVPSSGARCTNCTKCLFSGQGRSNGRGKARHKARSQAVLGVELYSASRYACPYLLCTRDHAILCTRCTVHRALCCTLLPARLPSR